MSLDKSLIPSPRLIVGLGRRGNFVLCLVAGLIVANQVLVQPSLSQLTSDAPVINVAGRQRMLSQRLSKAALALQLATTRKETQARLDELTTLLELWVRSHNGLLHGDRELSLPGQNNPQINAAFADLQPAWSGMCQATRGILTLLSNNETPAAAEMESHLQRILALEPEYLQKMDHIVGLYEQEARSRVQSLRGTGWALSAVSVGVLLTLWLSMLRPAVALIRRQFNALSAARDELESRVQARTAELETAYSDLKNESAERALAEEKQRELSQQLHRVARLSTMGEMATGLSHELNQPLAAIANYQEGCLVYLGRDDPPLPDIRDVISRSLAMCLRAGDIIKRIRSFVQRSEPEHERVCPKKILDEVQAMCAETARGRGILMEFRAAPDLQLVTADVVQIQQVIVNLVQNAMDAVADADQPVVCVEVRTGNRGETVFRVTDNGEGIPADRLPQVHDAFFSTRANGMGMGLAISRSILEAHQTRFEIESRVGKGSTFQFRLPGFHHG